MSISGEEFEIRVESFSEMLEKNTRNALTKNALRMMTQAKLNARSRMNQITGNLRNSIFGTVVQQGDEEYLLLRAGGYNIPTKKAEETADVIYAAVQEFGWKEQNIRPKWYMRDAFWKIEPKVEPDLHAAMRYALKGKKYG